MTATVRSTGIGNSGAGSATTFSPAMPAGFVAGDLLIGIAANGGGDVPATRPSGSTLVLNTDDGTVYNLDVVRKVAAGGDVFTWTTATARKWGGCVIAITTGTYDAVTPVQGAVGIAQGVSSVSFVTPASTPGNTDSLILASFGSQQANTWTCTSTAPTMTELCDTTSTGSLPASCSAYHSNTPPAASSLTRTGTASTGSANGAAFMLFVNPAAALASPRPPRRLGPNHRR